MKQICFILMIFFCASLAVVAQNAEVKAIVEKAQSGKQLSDDEMRKLQRWGEEMVKNAGQTEPAGSQKAISTADTRCPPKQQLSASPPLSRDGYVKLAKELMVTYGRQSGQEKELNELLASADQAADGADLGAMLMVAGAGSASVYSIAWSAAQQPDDMLTANNLGVALKDMGELSKALRVLNYADTMRPNVALIQSNIGWVYHAAGDPAQAIQQFRKALRGAPEMVSANLGMGLSLSCQGNRTEAEAYLRKALKERHSSAGIMAYREAAQSGDSGEQRGDQPLFDEKGAAEGLELPELPIDEEPEKMRGQQAQLENYLAVLQSRNNHLSRRIVEVSALIRRQQERAMRDPGNALVYRHDFATEMMHFEDITLLLLGETSNYGRAKQKGIDLQAEALGKVTAEITPATAALGEKLNRLQSTRLLPLMEELLRCGDDEICKAKVRKQIDEVKSEMEEIFYKLCRLSKQQLDLQLSAAGKSNGMIARALKEAAGDYYAFTDPILERIYAPALNEFYNLYREAMVFNEYIYLTGSMIVMAEMSKGYDDLICVEPEPPSLSGAVITDQVPVKESEPCPLGEDGIRLGVGIISFELSCTHVKISGGEGFLFSMKRDFAKHETTLWAGVGVKGEYGRGNVVGEASVGVELTVGPNDVVRDIAFTGSVKAGMGGLLETEISGRFAAEGGPSINVNAGLSLPSISF